MAEKWKWQTYSVYFVNKPKTFTVEFILVTISWQVMESFTALQYMVNNAFSGCYKALKTWAHVGSLWSWVIVWKIGLLTQ
jgi:hypothetical protein